jgi:hypothetical protein
MRYPQSTTVINELVRNEIDLVSNRSVTHRLVALVVDLPRIARSQHSAEASPTTRTAGDNLPISAEPQWRGSLRESLIWMVVAGWLLIVVSISMSFIQTGNFLFEYSPESGRPEIVTPYFKLVALSLMIQFLAIGSGLIALRVRR